MTCPRGEGVRQLLEQRAERSTHARYPSLRSEFDSPSVYSRSMRSPLADDHDELIRLPYQQTDRERLDDPALSSLDLESDPRYSFVEDPDSSDNEDYVRMSTMLGPNLRVNTRAPWEEGGDDDDDSPTNSYFTKRVGLNFGSPSPRSSESSRPSGESSRSQAKSKHSMDTTSSQCSTSRGALRSLAQASISSTSLAPSLSPAYQKPLVPKIRSDVSVHSQDISPSPMAESPHHTHFSHNSGRPLPFPFSSGADVINRADCDSPSGWSLSQSTEDNVHPYANPKHALRQGSKDPELAPPLRVDDRVARLMASRSDSSVTITESPSNSSASTKVSITIDTSVVRETKSRNRSSTIHGREISSPIAIQNRDDLSFMRNETKTTSPTSQAFGIPGWTERSSSPTFTLISLEEAQQRSRSATAQPAMQTSNRPVAFPTVGPDTPRVPDATSPVTRGRARSISAGVRTKVLTSIKPGPVKVERRDSEPVASTTPTPPPKQLRHKKSAFMRLFNSREKETLPPVPSLSDYAAPHPVPLQKPATISSYRVPVPSLSPTASEHQSDVGSISSASSSHTVLVTPSTGPDPSSLKRTPPPPINTAHLASPSLSARTSVPNPSRSNTLTVSGIDEPSQAWAMAKSAPSHQTEFPALKLRPVSSAFSTQFASHILAPDLVEEDLDSLSPSTSRSPITPAVSCRPSNEALKVDPIATDGADQPSIIQTLQEQILAAKRTWQLQISELEGQVKVLKAEVEEARALAGSDREYCSTCGRGQQPTVHDHRPHGIVNRPRAYTATLSRFTSSH